MELPVTFNNEPRRATLVFATKGDLTFSHDWRQCLGDDQNPVRRDTVELAEIAIHRFQAHSPIVPYARAVEDIGDHIRDNPYAEVGCLALLKCEWFPPSETIGFIHFRRTWCNRIVLDYLATHPNLAKKPSGFEFEVRGAGTALLCSLSIIARDLDCDLIWGEATQGSCGFYQKVLKLESVKDLIYAPRQKFLDFIDRMALNAEGSKEVDAAAVREEIYTSEVEHPPLVGSKTAVPSPTRRLAYRFLELPEHIQRQIADELGLMEKDDPEPATAELPSIYLQRASERGKLPELWRRVEANYPDGDPTNPFVQNVERG
jgi:hypothetical protein